MSAGLVSFAELLQRDGAELPRRKRGKGRCGHCEGKSWTLSVDLQRELAFCFRCHWKAGRRTLERELGIETAKPTPAEVRERRLIRREAERFTDWATRRRIETAALLRRLDRADIDWRELGRQELETNSEVSERTWERLHLAWLWAKRAEQTWRRLCEFEANAGELYKDFLEAAA